MYPIVLDLKKVSVMLVGNGPAAAQRLAQLDEDGAEHVRVFSDNPVEELVERAAHRLIRRHPFPNEFATTQIAMIVDIEEGKASHLATIARAFNVIVNVEDRKQYCDFYFPSFLRRGELLLAVSTSGASPILAKYIRGYLAETFGPEWERITRDIAVKRDEWKSMGLPNAVIIENTLRYIVSRGLLTDRAAREDELA